MTDTNKKGFLQRTAQTLGFTNPAPQQGRAVGGPAAGVIPPARSDAFVITPESALQVGAVSRSISILTASVSQMELGVFRNGVEVTAPPIIKTPNIDDSLTGFIEETIYSLAAYGNAYWRVYGSPVANLEVLDPNAVTISTSEKTGKKVYWIGATEVPANQIKHLRLFRKPGHLKGYGPIQHGTEDIRAALMLKDFQNEWFSNGAPTGMWTTDLPLNPNDSAELMAHIKSFMAEHGKTLIAHSGLRYEPFNIKPADAQFLEVQQASVVAIARLFGVPAMHLLAELSGTSNTYLNLEQANIVFLQTTLVKYMNEIEEALTSLLPRGQRVQFKEDGLLRMDSVTKWGVYKTQVEVGFTNGNELRKEQGKSPLPLPAAPVANEANSNEGSEQNGND